MRVKRLNWSPPVVLLVAILALTLVSLITQTVSLVADGLTSFGTISYVLDERLQLFHRLLWGTFEAAVLLGGIYATFRVDRFDRPLLVVAPAVFVVVTVFGLLITSPPDPTNPLEAQLLRALSGGLYDAVRLVAVIIVVRAVIGVSAVNQTETTSGE